MARRKKQINEFEEAVEKYLPFILEIRKRLLFTFAIFLLFAILGFIYYETLIGLLLKIFNLEGVNIVFTSPFQFLSLAVNTGILVGGLVVFPLLVFQILTFLRPALKDREFKTIVSLIPLSTLLFIGGFSFGVVMMRYVIILFYEKTVQLDIGNFLDISLLVSQILSTSLLMGIAFQFPIFITLVIRLGILDYNFFSSKRPFAYAISLIFATLLPPTDLFSLVLLTLPLILLFEVTLLLNRVFARKVAAPAFQ